MKLDGVDYEVLGIYNQAVTVPDCFVTQTNKLGTGHGEAKLYLGSKEAVRGFFGKEGFNAKCVILKSDLLKYLQIVKTEYEHPRFDYSAKDSLKKLWHERYNRISELSDEVLDFNIVDHTTIAGPRGYIKPVNPKDSNYKLLRQVALPLISFISVMALKDAQGQVFFYWKLFPDFNAMSDPLVFKYGKKANQNTSTAKKEEIDEAIAKTKGRNGQDKYRRDLLDECPFCPITLISDERLLIASHIKPWAMSNDQEKIDPHNGFILSPLYDKLFDNGLITFTDDKQVLISPWLTKRTVELIGIKTGQMFKQLPMTGRKKYLDFHRSNVFRS